MWLLQKFFTNFYLIIFLMQDFSLHIIAHAATWSDKFILDTFGRVSDLVRNQDLLWFISTELNPAEEIRIEETMWSLRNRNPIAEIILRNNSDFRVILSGVKRSYFSIVFTTGLNDPILDVHSKALTGRRMAMHLIIMIRVVHDFDVIRQFIWDMRERRFEYATLLVYYPNNSYDLWGYTLYPKFKLENRTDYFRYTLEKFGKGYANLVKNAHGFEFKTPLRVDVPYVFRYTNCRGEPRLYGTSYEIMETFAEYINATLSPYKMPKDAFGGDYINMRDALQLIREHKVEFIIQAYALFSVDDVIDKSFPLTVVNWCLMVPVWNSVSTLFYPVQSFDLSVWICCIATYLALILTEALWIIWLDGCKVQIVGNRNAIRKTNITNLMLNWYYTISDDFCYLLNIATGKEIKKPTKFIRVFLMLCIFFYGFFLSANYTSILGSILAITIFREDINTIDDLIRTNTNVMIIDYELDFLLEIGYELSDEFLRLIIPVDVATFNAHQLHFNTSYAYFITDDKWDFLSLQQIHLTYGLFKFSDICFGSYHLSYPIVKDSDIWQSMKYYLFYVQGSGVLEYYKSLSFDFAVQSGLLNDFSESKEYTSAGLSHLLMVFVAMCAVYVLTFLVFLGEICWARRFKLKCRKRRQRKRQALFPFTL